MVRVSVITLTWNHIEYTKKAVESIIPCLTSDDEFIFVDNKSTDGTQDYLQSLDLVCPTYVHVVEERCGCAHAYNIGFKKVKGDYIFIYDNDMEIVMKNTLDHMIEVFKNNKDAGIVCPCMNNIIGAVRSCPSISSLKNDIVEIHMGHNKWWPECPSAGWLLKRECLDKVGLFDEQFDPYGINDYDYARRVILAGFKILCDRFIFIQHYGSVTSKEYVTAKMLNVVQEKFYKKWAGDQHYPKGGCPLPPRR